MVIGLDASIRHLGGYVWESGEYMYYPTGLSLKSPYKAFVEAAREVKTWLIQAQPYTLVIDHGTNFTRYRSRKTQAELTAFFVGLLAADADDVVLVDPSDIRKRLGLTNKASKELVWDAIGVPCDLPNEHVMDAYALCWYWQEVSNR